MAAKALPSPEVLRQLLRYDPETGRLFWLPRSEEGTGAPREIKRWNTRYGNAEAFTSCDSKGYRHGHVMGQLLKAHRVIWAIQTGRWPTDHIDHINGTRDDNRSANLREATRAQNNRNRPRQVNNTSGFPGVHWDSKQGMWRATIRCDGIRKHLGSFDSPHGASAAYTAAAADMHGEFSRLYADGLLEVKK